MGMGIPVLHGVAGESADIVKKEGVGLVFEPENAEMLCESLREIQGDEILYQRLRERCITAASHYDRNEQARLMLLALGRTVAA